MSFVRNVGRGHINENKVGCQMRTDIEKVCYEEKDGIGYIIINDPPANKMTDVFLKEFIYVVRQYINGARVKGIIITGNGRHYSSGAEVEQLKKIVAEQSIVDDSGNLISYPVWYLENRNTFNYFEQLGIPVISAINGLCIGSGFELALCSHIRICGSGSILGLPESTFGFLPGVTGTLRYVEIMGIGKALEYIITGETFSSDLALELGLIDGIVNKKETLQYCEGLIKFIANKKEGYSKSDKDKHIKEFNSFYK
jgi:enoyl-CoA hydratase